jgi:sirohydrochlorin ferrochelatase
MPCSDGQDDVRYVYKDGHDPHYKQEAQRLSERCKELTILLCKAGRARHTKTNIPPEVIDWWNHHCKLDKSKGEPW